jgi:hypothetical protein
MQATTALGDFHDGNAAFHPISIQDHFLNASPLDITHCPDLVLQYVPKLASNSSITIY